MSSDARLDLAYKAIMQAALVATLAHGYRPATSEQGHHQLLIQLCPRRSESLAVACVSWRLFAWRATRATIAVYPSPTRPHGVRRRSTPARGRSRGWVPATVLTSPSVRFRNDRLRLTVGAFG